MRIDWALEEFDLAAKSKVAVFNAYSTNALRGFGNITAQQNDYARVMELRSANVDVEPTFPVGDFDVAVVEITRSKEETRDLIARASASAPFVIVDGQKSDGIESHYKSLRKLGLDVGSYTKAHGRIFWFDAAELDDWRATPKIFDNYETWPGFFSVGEIDRASAGLAAALPDGLSGNIADLGAGWGFLSNAILKCAKVKNVDLIESNFAALESAKKNVSDPRANFIWGDATSHRGTYDAVVMNPPFHKSRADDPALGRAFIQAAGKIVARHGVLWMVANRHLPYEAALAESFGAVETLPAPNGFKIFKASRPLARNRVSSTRSNRD